MKTFKVVKDVVLAVSAIGFVIAAILAFYFQTSFQTVTSRSMEPSIKAGDMVVTRQVPAKDIEMRDVVILPLPDADGLYFSHRIVGIKKQSGDVIVATKGDANPKPDSWQLKITSGDVPKVMAVIPTALIFNGPIERKWIYYGLFYGGALLGLYGSWRLVKR
jgi:signal peptidase I